MDTLQRRRQFFGKGVAYITFHGAGGQTATGDVTVIIPVLKGTVWMHVIKPEFMIPATAKSQSGFVFIQGEDDTAVDSDFVVNQDMEVFASYTVVESGIITFNGEVMSANGWIKKYGYGGTDSAYEGNDAAYLNHNRRGDLIAFLYGKFGNKAYAFPCEWSASGYTAMTWGGRRMSGGLQNTTGWPSYPLTGKHVELKYSYGGWWESDNYDEVDNWFDGKVFTAEIYAKLNNVNDDNGITGSPLIDECVYQLSAGDTFPAGSFFIASVAEVRMLFDNLQKSIKEKIFDPLISHSSEVNYDSGDINSLSHLCYRPETGTTFGFITYIGIAKSGGVASQYQFVTSTMVNMRRGYYNGSDFIKQGEHWAYMALRADGSNNPINDQIMPDESNLSFRYWVLIADASHLF